MSGRSQVVYFVITYRTYMHCNLSTCTYPSTDPINAGGAEPNICPVVAVILVGSAVAPHRAMFYEAYPSASPFKLLYSWQRRLRTKKVSRLSSSVPYCLSGRLTRYTWIPRTTAVHYSTSNRGPRAQYDRKRQRRLNITAPRSHHHHTPSLTPRASRISSPGQCCVPADRNRDWCVRQARTANHESKQSRPNTSYPRPHYNRRASA